MYRVVGGFINNQKLIMEKENKMLVDRIIGEVIEFHFDVSKQQRAMIESDILAILSNRE